MLYVTLEAEARESKAIGKATISASLVVTIHFSRLRVEFTLSPIPGSKFVL